MRPSEAPGKTLPLGARHNLRAVLCVYLTHLIIALGLSLPVAKLIADPVAAFPRGDLVLFAPGAAHLAEVLRVTRTGLTSVLEGMTLISIVVAYLGLLPLGGLLFALTRPERMNLRIGVMAATRFFGPFSWLLGLSLLAMVVAAAVPLLAGTLLDTKMKGFLGDRAYEIVSQSFAMLALLSIAFVGVAQDLARAAVVTGDRRVFEAATLGVTTLQTFPARALVGWAVRAVLGTGLVALAAAATTRMGIETTLGLASVFVVHQMVVFALLFLRADWLAQALALVRAMPEL